MGLLTFTEGSFAGLYLLLLVVHLGALLELRLLGRGPGGVLRRGLVGGFAAVAGCRGARGAVIHGLPSDVSGDCCGS